MPSSTRSPIYGPISICPYNPNPNFAELITNTINNKLGIEYAIDTLSGIITINQVHETSHINSKQATIQTMIWNGIIRDQHTNITICELTIRKEIPAYNETSAPIASTITSTITSTNNSTNNSDTDNIQEHYTTQVNIQNNTPNIPTKTYNLPIFCIDSISNILAEYLEQYILTEDITSLLYSPHTPLSRPSSNYTTQKRQSRHKHSIHNYDDFEQIEVL